MSIKENDFDFEFMKDKALEQLRSGESLYGTNGAFAPYNEKVFKRSVRSRDGRTAWTTPSAPSGNRRNGKSNKESRTS